MTRVGCGAEGNGREVGVDGGGVGGVGRGVRGERETAAADRNETAFGQPRRKLVLWKTIV